MRYRARHVVYITSVVFRGCIVVFIAGSLVAYGYAGCRIVLVAGSTVEYNSAGFIAVFEGAVQGIALNFTLGEVSVDSNDLGCHDKISGCV